LLFALRTEKKPQISPLRYPGFPVEIGGAGQFHAAFLGESRTLVASCVAWQEIRVRSSRDDKFIAGKFPELPVGTRMLMAQQICHLDRSAAEWRDLRFLLRPQQMLKGVGYDVINSSDTTARGGREISVLFPRTVTGNDASFTLSG
jgi:hypothetical protein